MSLVVNSQEFENMRQVVLTLLRRSESSGCLLCDSGGHVLVQEGPECSDPFLLSALGAGVFAASRELARILGEDVFSAVFHQGEKKSIFIRAITAEVLLVVIFTMPSRIGLVKLYSTPAAAELRQILERISTAGETAMPADHRQFVINQEGNLFAQH